MKSTIRLEQRDRFVTLDPAFLGVQVKRDRMSVIEPALGSIGHNKGLNSLSLRGKTKVSAQWQMYCLIHNIEKLKNCGQIAA